jgi:hypothetical protein
VSTQRQTQRQTHCCEWLLRAAFPVSFQPDAGTTVGDDTAANLPPTAHAGSTRHWIPCRAGYRASWGPAAAVQDTASAHSPANPPCGWASSAEFDDTCPCASSSGSVYGTACDADGRWGARLLALYRRGVRDCRRCGDDDLRRRHHGPRRADGRCLDVSVATSRSMLQLVSTGRLKFTLQPGVLYSLVYRSVSTVVQQAQCNTSMLQKVSVLLDVTMFVQQAHCDMLRCNSFSLFER